MGLHLSARLIWHDRGWDGHICNHPGKNSFCEGHIVVRERKNIKQENKDANRALSELQKNCKPACEASVQAYCQRANSIIHFPASFMKKATPEPLDLEKYSTLNWTYEEMWTENGEYKIQEERMKSAKKFYNNLRQHLDKCLIFFYVDERNPIGEETAKRLGQRILVGVSKLTSIGEVPIGYWNQKIPNSNENYMMWAVEIQHGYPDNGVRIPYQEYLARNAPVEEIAIPLVGDLRERFKWVGKYIDDDTATILIEKIIESIRKVAKDGIVNGKWQNDLVWLNKTLKEVWTERGPYPGIKGILRYLNKSGEWESFQKEIVNSQSISGKMDFIDKLKRWLDEIDDFPFSNYKKYFEDAIEEWSELNNNEKALLLKFCRFELNDKHIKIILSDDKRKDHGIISSLLEINENPYLLSEEYIGSTEDDFITFETIDLGMMPSEFIELRDKIKNKDRRRVRAIIIEKLHKSADDGHSFVCAKEIIDYVQKRCPENRKCEIELKRIISQKNKPFYAEKIEFFKVDEVIYLALKEITADEKEIRDRILSLLERDLIKHNQLSWKNILSKEKLEPDKEQIKSLKKSFRSPLSIITGEAGTGKSTLVSSLLNGIRNIEGRTKVLAITPTGKAADRLKEIGVIDAKTIHKELSEKGWFNWTTLTFKKEGDYKIEAENIVIDECSMVSLPLMATLFRAINWNYVRRLIMVGDYHQLPPIGCGRPFYDIIQHLNSLKEKGKLYINELDENYRIRKGSKVIALASSYAKQPEYNESELFRKIALGEELDDLKVVFWKDDSDLYNRIIAKISEIIKINCKKNCNSEYEAFNELLKESVDIWQIITATRQNYFGTTEINKYIQEKYHGKLIKEKGIKIGNELITYNDKVIQTKNDKTLNVKINGQIQKNIPVFNGQIGIAYPKWKSLKVIFDRIPNAIFNYTKDDVNKMLELAYAITVHKSQGSQFQHTFFVIPKEACRLLSRELVYTGLTRAKGTLTLFLQEDIEGLFSFRSLDKSEITKRNSRLFDLFVADQLRYKPEGLIHITSRGEEVRSKSEIIVADYLHELGLEYKYEERVYNKENDKNDFRLPDFTVFKDGKIFYLEHCGMTHDKDYIKKWQNERLPWYEKNGYLPQLIVTYDKQVNGQGVITNEVYDTIKLKIFQKGKIK